MIIITASTETPPPPFPIPTLHPCTRCHGEINPGSILSLSSLSSSIIEENLKEADENAKKKMLSHRPCIEVNLQRSTTRLGRVAFARHGAGLGAGDGAGEGGGRRGGGVALATVFQADVREGRGRGGVELLERDRDAELNIHAVVAEKERHVVARERAAGGVRKASLRVEAQCWGCARGRDGESRSACRGGARSGGLR